MNDKVEIPPKFRLTDAIRGKDFSVFQDLFLEHLDLWDLPIHGSWIHYAANEGALEIVKFLLEQGFDINGQEIYDGISPLTSACSGGHFDVVRYLLDHGARSDLTTSVRNPLFAVIVESIKDTMNKTWGSPTGEAPAIARLLLERGLDSKVRYNTKTMKNMDAVAFAMMMGAQEMAHVIALWNAGGDEAKARELLAEGDAIAEANTKPVPPGEQIALS